MDLLSKIIDGLSNLIPVHRWVDSATNALRGLVMAMIVLVFLAGIFSFTLDGDQRFIGAMVILGLMALIVLVLFVLASRDRGAGLYDPFQQSLFSGRRFGTKAAPKTKGEAIAATGVLPTVAEHPGLTVGDQKNLPPASGGAEAK